MSIATLPMYDFPDARAATDAWWDGVANHMRRRGVPHVPQRLTRGEDLFAEWRAPGLLLSQTCGYILQSRLGGAARVVATPHYSAPGCDGSRYASVILVSAGHGGVALEDFRGARAVYSLEYSHAGYNAFRQLIAPLANGAPFFRDVRSSGSHLDSINAVASGQADIATVDCIVHAFVKRHRPALLANVRSLGYTAGAPAPPYVTSAERSAAEVEAMRDALRAAAADPGLAAVRQALFIETFSIADATAYAYMLEVERASCGMNYPELR